VRQLLRRSDQGRVVATCRAPASAAELQKLRDEHAPGRLTVLPLDVTDEATIEVHRVYRHIGFFFLGIAAHMGRFV
jgi:saccharopine dehydrogenase-like NADP-dependent oxidoreductase